MAGYLISGEILGEFGDIWTTMSTVGEVRYPNDVEVSGPDFSFEISPFLGLLNLHGHFEGGRNAAVDLGRRIATALTARNLPFELEISPYGAEPIATFTHLESRLTDA